MSPLSTQRLILVPATAELAHAESEDPEHLWRLLGCDPPSAWPPPLNDQDSMKWYADFLAAHPGSVGWGLWYFLLQRPDQNPLPIGNGGFKGLPTADGTVEVGYSILEEHQRQGYAPEAVRALLAWAFSHPHVSRVIAHTLPDLTPSIRVLEKCGFRFVGEGTEEGAILFELRRELH
jgi:RimJ/RimL family protein N-acetyltransferase